MSVSLAVAPLEWQGHKINLIDSPGYADFYGEVTEAARVARRRPRPGRRASPGRRSARTPSGSARRTCRGCSSSTRWTAKTPTIARCSTALRERYGKGVVPLTFPIGRADGLSGVVDLLEGKAYTAGSQSPAGRPDAEQRTFDQLREMLVESACELDDDLINKYLEGEEITSEELARRDPAWRPRAASCSRCWPRRAADRSGSSRSSNAIVQLLPSPDRRRGQAGQRTTCTPTTSSAALVFKTVSDPNIGRLSYVRVYSGTLNADSHVWSVQKSKDERIGQIFHMRGKNQEPTQRLVTGDIGVIPKLAESVTGDTLSTQGRARSSSPGSTIRQAAYFAVGAPEVAQRRRQAEHRDDAPARRGPEPADAPRDVDQRGHPVRAGRLAPRGGDAAAAAQVRRQRHARRAQGGLSRDDHGQGARPRAATCGSRAATGSTESSISKSSRRRAARGSSSSTRWSAGSCRRQFIPAVEKGVRETLEPGRHRRVPGRRRAVRAGVRQVPPGRLE